MAQKDELSKKVEAEMGELVEKSGKAVTYSGQGPVGMGLIKLMVVTIQNQESRIKELEERLALLVNEVRGQKDKGAW